MMRSTASRWRISSRRTPGRNSISASGLVRMRACRPVGDVVAAEADRALAVIDAAHAIEHAGLAGAVRTNEREQLAGLDRERHAVEHGEPAETQREAIERELSHTTS